MNHCAELQKMNVTLGDGVAVIRREGSTAAIIATVLGRECCGAEERVYLDRLVHEGRQDWREWTASGAVSTILRRELPGTSIGAPAN